MIDTANRPTKRSNSMDIHVGTRIKLRRMQMGLSLKKLGDSIHVPFQQIQKYERGVNRVGASRLFDLSVVLNVPVSFFYDGIPGLLAADRGGEPFAKAVRPAMRPSEPTQVGLNLELNSKSRALAADTAELIEAFERIHDGVMRRSLLDMAKSLMRVSRTNQDQDPLIPVAAFPDS